MQIHTYDDLILEISINEFHRMINIEMHLQVKRDYTSGIHSGNAKPSFEISVEDNPGFKRVKVLPGINNFIVFK